MDIDDSRASLATVEVEVMPSKRVFISYTASDKTWANAIGEHLTTFGHIPRWQERHCLPGMRFLQFMADELDQCDILIALWSENYFKSAWAQMEFRAVMHSDPTGALRRVVPVRLEDCVIPRMYADLVYVDVAGRPSKADALTKVAAAIAQPPSQPEQLAAQDTTTVPQERDNLPFRLTRTFTGREKELVEIDEYFRDESGSKLISLAGMAGIGKSTLALEYAHAKATARFFNIRWWIDASSASSAAQSLTELGVHAGILSRAESPGEAVQKTLRWLRDHGDGALLVYDNATSAEVLSTLVPNPSEARILVSTRSDAAATFADKYLVLDSFSQNEAKDFLRSRIKAVTVSDEDASAIADRLGGLPLALEHAAAYMDGSKTSAKQYLLLFQSEANKLLRANDGAHTYNADPRMRSVAAAILLSIRDVTRGMPAASMLLLVIADFPEHPIPKWVFDKGLEGTQYRIRLGQRQSRLQRTADFLRSFVGSGAAQERDRPFPIEESIRALSQSGLIRLQEMDVWGEKVAFITRHRLVDLVVRTSARRAIGGIFILDLVLAGLMRNSKFEFSDNGERVNRLSLLPHVLALADNSEIIAPLRIAMLLLCRPPDDREMLASELELEAARLIISLGDEIKPITDEVLRGAIKHAAYVLGQEGSWAGNVTVANSTLVPAYKAYTEVLGIFSPIVILCGMNLIACYMESGDPQLQEEALRMREELIRKTKLRFGDDYELLPLLVNAGSGELPEGWGAVDLPPGSFRRQ